MDKNSDIWPRIDGVDVATMSDPITGVPMCRDCWDGAHKKLGCQKPQCLCDCYRGRVKSTTGLVKPKADVNTELPDCGSIEF